jgi:hypothetical protein
MYDTSTPRRGSDAIPSNFRLLPAETDRLKKKSTFETVIPDVAKALTEVFAGF